MKSALGSHLALLTAIGLSSVLLPSVAQAVQFGQAEIADYQSRFAIIASPIGTTGTYKLIIFEQLNNRRQCWQDVGSNPTVIEPLFMQFDFTGICGRSTDSNAYSVRVAGQDLAGRYNLRLVRQANDLVLVAFSLTDKNLQFFPIGRTHGLAEGYLKVELDPGWRLTRRTYEGKSIGHIYLTSDRSLAEIASTASPMTPDTSSETTTTPTTATPSPATPMGADSGSQPVTPSTAAPSTTAPAMAAPPTTAPSTTAPAMAAPPTTAPAVATPPPLNPQNSSQSIPAPAVAPVPQPASPPQAQPFAPPPAPSTPSFPAPQPTNPATSTGPAGGYVVPVIPSQPDPAPVAAPKSLPSAWENQPQSSVIMPTGTAQASTGYRVVVAQPTPDQQEQIRQLVPGAFRTVVNGQSVMQVGVFRDRAIALSLQQQLAAYNLTGQIVPVAIAALPQPMLSSNSGNPGMLPPLQPMPGFSSRFGLPAPVSLSAPLSLWSTYYYTHRAEAAPLGSSAAYPLLNPLGNPLGVTLSHRDWCAAALEGSVQVVSDQQILGTYNFAGRGDTAQVDCSTFYPRLSTIAATNRVRFKLSSALFGEGVQGNSLVPYRTIAVDQTQIPIGSVLYIPAARGTVITLPSGQQAVHDGYFYAADVGSAVRGNHVDLFLGVAERSPFRFVTSNPADTFTAYLVTDPQIQAQLAAEHRSGRVAFR